MSKAATNFPLYLPNYQDGYADRFENRDGNYSAMRLARNYTNSGSIIIPDSVREFKERGWEDTRPIQYPLIDNYAGNVTQGNMNICVSPVTDIDTATGTMVTLEYYWSFTMKPEDHFTNAVDYGTEWAKKYMQNSRLFAQTLNTLVINTIDANVNTYFPVSLTDDWYPTNVPLDGFSVTEAQFDTLYNNLQGILYDMDFNNQSNEIDILAKSRHVTNATFNNAQGAGNDTNLNFQYAPYNFYMEKDIPLTAGANTTAIAMIPNTVFLESTVAPDPKFGSVSGDGAEWGVERDPLTGLEIGTLYNSKCDAGTLQEHYIYYTKVSCLVMYNSDPVTRYSPYIKFDIVP